MGLDLPVAYDAALDLRARDRLGGEEEEDAYDGRVDVIDDDIGAFPCGMNV